MYEVCTSDFQDIFEIYRVGYYDEVSRLRNWIGYSEKVSSFWIKLDILIAELDTIKKYPDRGIGLDILKKYSL